MVASGAAARAFRTDAERTLAPAHPVGRVLQARRHRHHHALADRAQRRQAPLDHGLAGKNGERLGAVGSKAFAATAGGNDPDDGQGVR